MTQGHSKVWRSVSYAWKTAADFLGFDVLISAVGNPAMKNQPDLIDTAIAGGVRHFYPSEFGADLTVGNNWNERYYRDKVITRIHLQKRAADNPSISYTYVLTGRLMEWAIIPHIGIYLEKHMAHIVGAPEVEMSLLSAME